ncbi:hypothetical protein LIER_27438 [Lithospermum erythrorhizon]|uniref:Retrovirus-related Pol polyprotein from transposon TNT 1-94 n=1 Tax=Lithospermum erythrorhizon TaxID=34254 RepID=A0AAV3RFE1_LITER
MTITEYLNLDKSTYNALATIGKQLPHETFLIYILRGLKEDFKDLKSLVYSRGSHMSFEELRNFLGTHEFVNLVTPLMSSPSDGLLPTPPPIVQYVARPSAPNQRGRGRSSMGHFARNRSLGFSNNDRRSSASSSDQRKCFLCDSLMHLANTCPHRNSSASPQANFFSHSSFSARPSSTPGQSSSTTSQYGDAIPYFPWIPDTGASHHITPDLASLQNSDPYHGCERVQVANGQHLSIHNIGSGNASPATYRTE